jgi:hypothetical protein
MKIAFHINQLCLRGTAVATYDYAHFNETLLKNSSIILSKDPSVWPHSNEPAILKFQKRFPVFFYKNENEIESILDEENVDIFYAMKAGFKDNVVSSKRKTIVHAVFQHNEPHGDVYAYISQWLGNRYKSPFVPYMVYLPEVNINLREELNIPKDAIVFGRHGGKETFDIPFVRQVVKDAATARKDIYFLFLFTDRFTDPSLENVIYLEGESDLEYKTKFINTCDAMLHARKTGETFGLSVAEFSIRNKPVITHAGHQRESAHLQMLGEKAIKYYNTEDLTKILTTFTPTNKDWNAYKDYSPEKVMQIFNNVFIN